MVAGYRDNGICPGLLSQNKSSPPPCYSSNEESSSLHVAPRHAAVITQYTHGAFMYILLTHYPTADCTKDKPSTLRRD